jgi:hypothetical protein
MFLFGLAVNTHFKEVCVTHFKEFADVFVLVTGKEAEFVFAKINGYGVRVKFVVGFSFQSKLGTYSKMIKRDTAFPIRESGDLGSQIMTMLFHCFLLLKDE